MTIERFMCQNLGEFKALCQMALAEEKTWRVKYDEYGMSTNKHLMELNQLEITKYELLVEILNIYIDRRNPGRLIGAYEDVCKKILKVCLGE